MAPVPPPSPRSAEFAYSTSLRKGLPHAAADLSHSAQAALDRAEESLVELAVQVGLKHESPDATNGNGNGHHVNGNGDAKLVSVAVDAAETPSEAFSKLSVQVRAFVSPQARCCSATRESPRADASSLLLGHAREACADLCDDWPSSLGRRRPARALRPQRVRGRGRRARPAQIRQANLRESVDPAPVRQCRRQPARRQHRGRRQHCDCRHHCPDRCVVLHERALRRISVAPAPRSS